MSRKEEHSGYVPLDDLAGTEVMKNLCWNKRHLAALAGMGWIKSKVFRETGNGLWIDLASVKKAIIAFAELQRNGFPNPNDLDKQI